TANPAGRRGPPPWPTAPARSSPRSPADRARRRRGAPRAAASWRRRGAAPTRDHARRPSLPAPAAPAARRSAAPSAHGRRPSDPSWPRPHHVSVHLEGALPHLAQGVVLGAVHAALRQAPPLGVVVRE